VTKSQSDLADLLKDDVMIASEIREGMAFVKGHDINIIRQAIRLERFKPVGPAACLLIPLSELEAQSTDIDRKELIDNGEIPYDVLPLAQPVNVPEASSHSEMQPQQHQEVQPQSAALKLTEPGKHLESSNPSSSIDVEEQQRLEQQRQQHEHQQIQLHLQRQQQAELQAQLLEQQKQLQEQQRLFAVQMEQQQQQHELQRQQNMSRAESVSASQHRPRVSIIDTSMSMQKLNLEPELNAISVASSNAAEADQEWTRIKSGHPSVSSSEAAAVQPEPVVEVSSNVVEVEIVPEASSQVHSQESKSADRSPVLTFLRTATMSPSVLSPGMAVHSEQQPEVHSTELNSSQSESNVPAVSAPRHSTFVPQMQPIEEPVSEAVDDESESQPKQLHQPSELNASMAIDTTQSSSSNPAPVSPAAVASSMPKLSALSKIKAGMSGVLMKQSNFGLSFNDRFVILSLPESDLSISSPQTKATFVRNKISSSRVQIMMPDEWKLLPTMKMWNTAEDSQRIPLGPKYVWYVHGFECGAQVVNAAMNRDEEGDDDEAEQQKASTRSRYVDHELVVLVSDESEAPHSDLKRVTFWCLTSPVALQRWVSHLLRCCALKNDPIQSIEMFFGSEEDEEPESQGIIGDLVQQNQLVQQANNLPRQASLARQPTLARQSTMSVPTDELDPVALLRMATKTKKLTDLDMAISVGGQTPESDRSTEMKQLMTVAKIVRESLLKRAASVPHPGSQSAEVAPAMHRRTTSASTTSKRSSVDERAKKKEKILDVDSADAKPSMTRKKSSLKMQRSGPDDGNRASSRGSNRA
jgi:hypothetical protein